MDALRGNTTSVLRSASQTLSSNEQGVLNENAMEGDEENSQQDLYQGTPEQADELELEEEYSEGQRQEDELLEQYPVWDCPDASEQMQRLLETVVPMSRRLDVEYQFIALDTDVPFASSCAHGAVYFSRGLLQTLSPDSLLFFAAHEMAHTELRHFATRRRRLDDLRRAMPAPPGSAVRQRMELAAVLAVRHQEEFEADQLAARWIDPPTGCRALQELHQTCLRLSPESLNRPTHPPFEKRWKSLESAVSVPDPVEYLWSLMN